MEFKPKYREIATRPIGKFGRSSSPMRRCSTVASVNGPSSSTQTVPVQTDVVEQQQPLDDVSRKRLIKELMAMRKDPPPNCSAEIIDDNIYCWLATIIGPESSVYAGGHFLIDLRFTFKYPFEPPRLRFRTRIYHCNVDSRGTTCLDILRNRWSPVMTVAKILLSVWMLLGECNPDDPIVIGIAEQYKSDRKNHDKVARYWTERFAQPVPAGPKKLLVPHLGKMHLAQSQTTPKEQKKLPKRELAGRTTHTEISHENFAASTSSKAADSNVYATTIFAFKHAHTHNICQIEANNALQTSMEERAGLDNAANTSASSRSQDDDTPATSSIRASSSVYNIFADPIPRKRKFLYDLKVQNSSKKAARIFTKNVVLQNELKMMKRIRAEQTERHQNLKRLKSASTSALQRIRIYNMKMLETPIARTVTSQGTQLPMRITGKALQSRKRALIKSKKPVMRDSKQTQTLCLAKKASSYVKIASTAKIVISQETQLPRRMSCIALEAKKCASTEAEGTQTICLPKDEFSHVEILQAETTAAERTQLPVRESDLIATQKKEIWDSKEERTICLSGDETSHVKILQQATPTTQGTQQPIRLACKAFDVEKVNVAEFKNTLTPPKSAAKQLYLEDFAANSSSTDDGTSSVLYAALSETGGKILYKSDMAEECHSLYGFNVQARSTVFRDDDIPLTSSKAAATAFPQNNCAPADPNATKHIYDLEPPKELYTQSETNKEQTKLRLELFNAPSERFKAADSSLAKASLKVTAHTSAISTATEPEAASEGTLVTALTERRPPATPPKPKKKKQLLEATSSTSTNVWNALGVSTESVGTPICATPSSSTTESDTSLCQDMLSISTAIKTEAAASSANCSKNGITDSCLTSAANPTKKSP